MATDRYCLYLTFKMFHFLLIIFLFLFFLKPFESTRLTGESRLEDGGSCQYDNSDQEQGSPVEAQQAKNSTKDRDSLMT